MSHTSLVQTPSSPERIESWRLGALEALRRQNLKANQEEVVLESAPYAGERTLERPSPSLSAESAVIDLHGITGVVALGGAHQLCRRAPDPVGALVIPAYVLCAAEPIQEKSFPSLPADTAERDHQITMAVAALLVATAKITVTAEISEWVRIFRPVP